MDFKTQCANCHAPLAVLSGVRRVPFGVFACSEGCEQDLSDMLDAVHDTGYYDEIKARGRTVTCDCTKYCGHCLALKTS